MTSSRVHSDGLERCSWLNDDPIYIAYHDNEWGRRATGQRDLFEAIALEGFQAGLSWLTILKRRDGSREAFHNANVILERDLDLRNELWAFAPAQRLTNTENFEWLSVSKESIALSKALRKLGFKFVGPTTMYALMQSTGMIHDHAPNCHWRE